MTTTDPSLPLLGRMAGFRRFTVAEYHNLIATGFLTENDDFELLEGYLVHKMSRHAPHDFSTGRVQTRFQRIAPADMYVRVQMAITLAESEPEPDVALVRGPDDRYRAHHPRPDDIGIVIDVADSSLDGDRTDKCRIYGRAGLPVYWIVNLVDHQVEVYTQPTGPCPTPATPPASITSPDGASRSSSTAPPSPTSTWSICSPNPMDSDRMIAITTGMPAFGGNAAFRRFSVADYERMTAVGILSEEDEVELLEGLVVLKMSRNAPHDGAIDLAHGAFRDAVPGGWWIRIQQTLKLDDSIPEPDVLVVRGGRRSFVGRHPGAGDVGIVVEIAESSLKLDRQDKCRIYGRAGLPVYWIVNLVDRQVEVYTQPTGPCADPDYATRVDYKPGRRVPVVLDGTAVADLDAADLLP